jgi:transposase-like protein
MIEEDCHEANNILDRVSENILKIKVQLNHEVCPHCQSINYDVVYSSKQDSHYFHCKNCNNGWTNIRR